LLSGFAAGLCFLTVVGFIGAFLVPVLRTHIERRPEGSTLSGTVMSCALSGLRSGFVLSANAGTSLPAYESAAWCASPGEGIDAQGGEVFKGKITSDLGALGVKQRTERRQVAGPSQRVKAASAG
jgi:hypothetical protein